MSFISKFLWRSPAASTSTTEIRKIAVRDSPAGLKTLSGRFAVGFIDVEWEDSDNLNLDVEETKLLGHEIPFVLARIYYPTTANNNTEDEKENGNWLPSSHYFPGYGYFLRLPSLVSSGIGRLLAANVKIRAKEAAPLLSIPAASQEKLPVVIFSHGLAGIRTTYSTICCELASRGLIVLALEHRDGSASMTIDRKGKVYPYRFGPSGLSLPMADYEYRAAQLRHRINEIKSTNKFLTSLNQAGDFASILLSSSILTETIKQFKDRMLIERLILMGHSFGGGTCLAAAQELQNVKCCVAWDPWMFPMPQPALQITRTDIDTLLIINEKFTWSENDAAIQKFIDDFRDTQNCFGKARMLGCGHMDQSDLASIIPSRIIQLLRPNSSVPTNHHRVLQANIDLVSAHLAAAFPMFSFDAKWTMSELSTLNRQISPLLPNETIKDDQTDEFFDPIIKLENFINYK